MGTATRRVFSTAVILAGAVLLGGCATLTITPRQQVNAAAVKQPVSVGVQVTGERLTEALSNPEDSATRAATGKLFDKVIVLGKDTRGKSPAELQAAYGTDYILTGNLADISVSGNLNPYWFISFPLLFFKPFTPIVTFEAVVTVEGTLRDARTGAVILQREMSSVATDHYSPINPQEKVRKLIARGINNAFVSLLEEAQQKIAVKK
jgi:hypothetical protein